MHGLLQEHGRLRMWRWFHELGSPPHFYRVSRYWMAVLAVGALVLSSWGLYLGLFVAPTDYEQGEVYRIIYVHVPSAWMSMFCYVFMAISAAIGLIWRMKMAEITALATAPIGASFTALALVTGMLWGKPTWNTYWQWDARMTSELLLLFLYFGYIALYNAIEDTRSAARAAAILAIVGVVNIPIIHYSVTWWHSLHQPSSSVIVDTIKDGVSSLTGPDHQQGQHHDQQIGKPSQDTTVSATANNVAIAPEDVQRKQFKMQPEMRKPLLLVALGFMLYFGWAAMLRIRLEVLSRERNRKWVAETLNTARNTTKAGQ